MINAKPMSHKIIKVYLLGALVLLAFYSLVFTYTIQYTENKNSERRLALIAPHHFNLLSDGFDGEIQIDPMLKIFSQYEALPSYIKRRVANDWQGSATYHFEDDSEYSVFAQQVTTKNGLSIFYALEDIDVVEWDDTEFLIFQSIIFGVGLIIFIVAALFIVQMAKRISAPFTHLASQLTNKNDNDYAEISVDGEISHELIQVLTSINIYRYRIQQAFMREQAFARYVSHELRTPMTVIRGAVSVLRRLKVDKVQKQSTQVDNAVIEMEQLVHTFLLLAKDDQQDNAMVDVTDHYITELLANFAPTIKANQVIFHQQLQCAFSLKAQPLLFAAVIQNLLKNAINCSVDGQVDLFISPQRMDIIDNGVGLDAKPRGYEGFGIGLNIVHDICHKYHWTFELKNNSEQGCTASVIFTPQTNKA